MRLPDERYLVTVRALERLALGVVAQTEPYEKVQATPAVQSEDGSDSAHVLAARVQTLWAELHEDEEIAATPNPSALADLVAEELPLGREARRALLLELDVRARLEVVLRELTARRGAHQAAKAERAETRRQILRTQLKQIKKELGDASVEDDEDNEWVERVRAAKLPAETEAAALREARRLGTLGEGSAEANVARTYLEWLARAAVVEGDARTSSTSRRRAPCSTPTTTASRRSRSASSSTSRCASWRRTRRAPILCLVGPPGVGKTSLGQSIARALGREFVRISLGGVRDEAEIRGHRRTYIGALPGRIIQGMKRAGTRNPVFMLDEIDKLGADFRGDPAAALLEVLDPEQNNTFTDHYLEVPFDLSEVHVHRHGERSRRRFRRRCAIAWRSSSSPATRRQEKLDDRARAPRARSSSPSTASTGEHVALTPTRRSTRSSSTTRARRACATSSARSAASSAASR